MNKLIPYILLLSLFFLSCKKETGVDGPSGPPGNNGLNGSLLDTGTLAGTLAIYNEFGWPLADSSGVVVSLKAGATELTSTTNSSGVYTFHGLGAGTYNLTYTKTGYGIMKLFGVPHTPGSATETTIPQIYLLQLPHKTIVDSLNKTEAYNYVYVNIKLDTSSLTYVQWYGNFVLLIGTNPVINESNTAMHPNAEFITPDGSGGYSLILDRSLLGGINHEGGTYYIRVGVYNRYIHKVENPGYLFDTGLNAMYVSPDDGNQVYPNLQLSPTILKIQ